MWLNQGFFMNFFAFTMYQIFWSSSGTNGHYTQTPILIDYYLIKIPYFWNILNVILQWIMNWAIKYSEDVHESIYKNNDFISRRNTTKFLRTMSMILLILRCKNELTYDIQFDIKSHLNVLRHRSFCLFMSFVCVI